jgi:gluconokinase
MGVTGSGKTTIGRMLAESLGWLYFDADDFHPADNIEKMSRGIPLDDPDRQPWLASLAQLIQERLRQGQPAVVSCSSLKRSYREALRIDESVRFAYLQGDYDLIRQRLSRRTDHYMNPTLLDSQFQTLEEPEDALRIDVRLPPDEIVTMIRNHFKL